MSAIMTLKCNCCEYEKSISQSSCFLSLPDGDEMELQHPAEDLQAHRFTGKHLPELINEGLIKYRYGLVCTKCGECSFYELENYHEPKAKHLNRLLCKIPSEDTEGVCCKFCGEKTLWSVMGLQTGCILAFLNIFSAKKDSFPCPKCKKGQVAFEMTGIS